MVLSIENLKRYIGICLPTSVVHLPNLSNRWKPTIGAEAVRKAICVNQFEKTRRFLHFNDNSIHESLPVEGTRSTVQNKTADGFHFSKISKNTY